ncbi:hypothetical protein [Cohnella nanjingensis]|uniref:DNA/RNA helicase n=1 Tax=Cohnella nanjingensis TaxID=1387779 RepID=A0A7X0RT71_9BACL|nr:hypothetical protein [Cohnella nanjingensis]MBB6673263.1 hypothetical protein [Cohnella nanjingensis]
MNHHAALMFRFPQENNARLAYDTLEELGYEPHLHEGGRLHIHIVNEDLTSALEIVQSFGGELIEQAPAEESAITSEAYGLDCIPIPAHLVNEDGYDAPIHAVQERDTDGSGRRFEPDDGSYDHFEAR